MDLKTATPSILAFFSTQPTAECGFLTAHTSEATDLIYRDGYYYLLGTHGTCCDGVNSTYNIVCGRSKKVTGPYIDNVGRDMKNGGGKMVIAAGKRVCGPGHFGRTVIDEGVEIMSCHFEADFDRSGRSVLGIRPLLWRNGWPVAGESFKEGTYQISSERRGYSLELAVDFVRMNQERAAWHHIDLNEPLKQIPDAAIYSLDTLDSSSFTKFWSWVSASVGAQSQRSCDARDELPPPPEEIQLIF